jgi:hypothetical protein
VLAERGQPGLAVLGAGDVELDAGQAGLLAQHGLEHRARELVVVDDEDADRHRRAG